MKYLNFYSFLSCSSIRCASRAQLLILWFVVSAACWPLATPIWAVWRAWRSCGRPLRVNCVYCGIILYQCPGEYPEQYEILIQLWVLTKICFIWNLMRINEKFVFFIFFLYFEYNKQNWQNLSLMKFLLTLCYILFCYC